MTRGEQETDKTDGSSISWLPGTFTIKPEQINDPQAMKCVLEDFCRPGKDLPLVVGSPTKAPPVCEAAKDKRCGEIIRKVLAAALHSEEEIVASAQSD